MPESGGHQHLGAVGDDSLYEAQEKISIGWRCGGIYLEPVRYILGDRAGHDEGDRIVGRAKVGEAHQGRYAHLGPLEEWMRGVFADDPVDTPRYNGSSPTCLLPEAS